MDRIPLEDNCTDIIGKAQGGLGLADAELARRAGVSVDQVHAAKAANPPLDPLRGRGTIDEAVIRKLAAALQLGADALVASAKQAWYPAEPGAFIGQAGPGLQAGTLRPSSGQAPVQLSGLACFNTPFSDMTVNSYLVFDPQTRLAVAFDTGTDCDPMLTLARDRGLKIELILLTHTHGDHVYELDRLKEATGAKAYVNERETMPGATPFADGHVFELPTEWDRLPACPPPASQASRPLRNGTNVSSLDPKTGGTPVPRGNPNTGGTPVPLRIETRRTSGHARGGTTFVVTGLPPLPSAGGVRGGFLAVVGDALFAGSMGGGMVNYAEALRTNRESIFTLPDDTVICPGHGPLTTVGEEKAHNPFFPEFQKQ